MIPIRRRQHGQPAVGRPAQRWLDRGLVYADLLTTYPANTITGQADTITGTKVATARWGLARGFGATLGVGTTDAVRTNLTAHATNRTYIVRFFLRSASAGGGGLGRIFDKQVTAASEAFYVNNNGGAPHLRFARTFTTGQTEYATQNNSVVNGQSYVLAVTYDSSSPSNAPRIWINGGLQSLTSLSTGTGSAIVTTDAYALGNRPSDSLRNIDGWISDFFVFDSILSNGDIEELSSDLNQIWQDRRIWVPVAAAGATFKSAWARGCNTVISSGARP